MTIKRLKSTGGTTLVEVMLAIFILLITVLGASGYRYYAALDARKADLQTTAARIASLLCESWRGASDPNTFDPIQLTTGDPNSTLVVETSYDGPAVPADFTLLGIYKITINGVNYNAVLSWKDISQGLRALNVIVAWNPRGSQSELPDKSFKLTTYTAN
jgi:hypothetical protein